MKTDYKKASNTELVEHCGRHPDDRYAWQEFCRRFDEHIWLVTYRECRSKGIFKTTLEGQKIVGDLVQDVYLKLLIKNCRALKEFKGEHENSIFTYLTVIAVNIVKNYLVRTKAKKRPQINGSMDDISPHKKLKKEYESPDTLADKSLTHQELLQEIDKMLDIVLAGKDKERNKLIFHLFYFQGFSADEIAAMPPIHLSSKRISNLASETKKQLCVRLLEQHEKFSENSGTMLHTFVLTNR